MELITLPSCVLYSKQSLNPTILPVSCVLSHMINSQKEERNVNKAFHSSPALNIPHSIAISEH